MGRGALCTETGQLGGVLSSLLVLRFFKLKRGGGGHIFGPMSQASDRMGLFQILGLSPSSAIESFPLCPVSGPVFPQSLLGAREDV